METRYYKKSDSYIATTGALELLEITKEEFEAAMERAQNEIDSASNEPAPTLDERVARLEQQREAEIAAYQKGVNDV